jgi:hypothetical protein
MRAAFCCVALVAPDLVDMARHFTSKRPQGVNISVDRVRSQLRAAVNSRNVEVSRLLLGLSIGVDIRGSKDQSPLHLVADRGNFKMDRTLIDWG